MITITKIEKKEPLFHKLLKKLFGFDNSKIVKEVEFKFEKAVNKGKCFRKCLTSYLPSAKPPFDESNWNIKVCAIVIFGIKICHFSVLNNPKGVSNGLA